MYTQCKVSNRLTPLGMHRTISDMEEVVEDTEDVEEVEEYLDEAEG